MADLPKQTQTTATPANTSPEGAGPSATRAPSTPARAESKPSPEAMIEAAFAAADEAPETDAPQATDSTETDGSDAEESDTTDDQDETEASTEEGETEAESETTDTEEDDTVNLDDVDDLTEEAMKKVRGADNVPKGFVKRLVKQSKQIRDFKAEIASLKAAPPVTLTPTPLSPLADVESLDALEDRIAEARAFKAWAKDHPEGDHVTRNGKQIEITAEQVQARLERAEAVLDAYADKKIALKEREVSRPWETAEKIAPGILKPGTPENQIYLGLLQTCPEIKERFLDHERILAYAIKGYQIASEEAAGKAKYIRQEFDGKGKPIVPAAKSSPATVQPKPKAPASPQATRPALQAGAGKKLTREEVIAAMPAHLRNDPESRTRALIEAAEEA